MFRSKAKSMMYTVIRGAALRIFRFSLTSLTFHLLTKPCNLTKSKWVIIHWIIWSINYRMFPSDGL